MGMPSENTDGYEDQGVCSMCGATHDVWEVYDPYYSLIEHILSETLLCKDCYQEELSSARVELDKARRRLGEW